MKPQCQNPDHPPTEARHQITLYTRPDFQTPFSVAWRGFSCEACLAGTMQLLKKGPGTGLLIVYPIGAKREVEPRDGSGDAGAERDQADRHDDRTVEGGCTGPEGVGRD